MTANPQVLRSSAWYRALGVDLYDGLYAWRLWTMLGWNDILQRYRRSYLGPFWMTISMGALVAALGSIYSHLFHVEIETYLPYLTLGFVAWNMISTSLKESCQAFRKRADLMKQIKVPFSTYVLRVVWGNLIVLAHTAIIFIPISLYFGQWPKPVALLAIPGLVLLSLNLVWIGLVLAVLDTRFPDVSLMVETVLQIAVFMTPIMWPVSALGERAFVADINPFHHLIEVVRAPLLGDTAAALSWIVVVAMVVMGALLAVLLFRRVEQRLVYWL